jgi:hypothetical protein
MNKDMQGASMVALSAWWLRHGMGVRRIVVKFPAGTLLQIIQAGSEAHPAYSLHADGFFHRDKAVRA